MGWFLRQAGDHDRAQLTAALNTAVDDSGLLDALDHAAGRGGLRRFVIQFQHRGGRARLLSLDTEPLASGGPPDGTTFDARGPGLERVVEDLARRLPPGFEFERLHVGFVRDQLAATSGPSGGPTASPVEVSLRFDEDCAGFSLGSLRQPQGKGSVVETAAYQRALGQWTQQMSEVQRGWIQPAPGEEWWLDGNTLHLGAEQGRRLIVEPIASFVPSTGDFTWLLERVAGPEEPFREREHRLELERVIELVLFAGARLGHRGVFQGEAEEPAGVLFFAGVRE